MIFETSLALQMIETDRDGLEKTLRRLQDIENLVEKLVTDICTIRFAPRIHTAKKKLNGKWKLSSMAKNTQPNALFLLWPYEIVSWSLVSMQVLVRANQAFLAWAFICTRCDVDEDDSMMDEEGEK